MCILLLIDPESVLFMAVIVSLQYIGHQCHVARQEENGHRF